MKKIKFSYNEGSMKCQRCKEEMTWGDDAWYCEMCGHVMQPI